MLSRREFVKRSGLWVPAAVGLLLPRKTSAAASWRVGLNFRSTELWRTDGADETYVLANESSPTTRKTSNGNEVTFVWSSTYDVRAANRSVTEPRLGGAVYVDTPWVYTLIITLPTAGTYSVRMAVGHVDGGVTPITYLKDNGSTLITVTGALSTTYRWLDATSTEYNEADWIKNNTAATVVFTTTVCQLVLGTGTPWTGFISHLYLELVSAPGVNRKVRVVVQ